ncbi:MAG: hypothetical protein AAB116_20375 [Candidatus Poribacteria bacterium]
MQVRKYLFVLYIIIFTPLPCFAGADIAKNDQDGIITITSDFVFYGSLAKAEIVKSLFDRTQEIWVEHNNFTIQMDNKTYSLRFVLSYRIVSEFKAKLISLFSSSYETVLVRIDENNGMNVAFSILGNNSMQIPRKKLYGTDDSVLAHEYGHILGLEHHKREFCQTAQEGPEYPLMCVANSFAGGDYDNSTIELFKKHAVTNFELEDLAKLVGAVAFKKNGKGKLLNNEKIYYEETFPFIK